MSELINNSRYRKERLKELILKLHDGESAAKVRAELVATLKHISYGEVIAPFIPAPLLDKSLSLNYRHWLKKESDEKFVIYFGK